MDACRYIADVFQRIPRICLCLYEAEIYNDRSVGGSGVWNFGWKLYETQEGGSREIWLKAVFGSDRFEYRGRFVRHDLYGRSK